jgi:hypothetical protein
VSALVAATLLLAIGWAALHASTAIRLRVEDTNGDGRPDIWRYYDRGGKLIRVEIDTNFDGRSDVQESYANGRLVKRESDRNFDGRVDLIDEFDVLSGQHLRSVADKDFDGIADLLVLFADGAPVFSRWFTHNVPQPQPYRDRGLHDLVQAGLQGRTDQLWSLRDPFSSDYRLRSLASDRAADPAMAELPSTAGGLAVLPLQPGLARARASRPTASALSIVLPSPAPRGPPGAAPIV